MDVEVGLCWIYPENISSYPSDRTIETTQKEKEHQHKHNDVE